MKNKLTQKKIDKLDKIGHECGYELHLPPFKDRHYPFFVLNDNQESCELMKKLGRSKFNIECNVEKSKQYIMIKG